MLLQRAARLLMWIQDPNTPGPFSSESIKWTQNIAYIPHARLKDFIAGESNGRLNPTIFVPRKRYMRVPGSLSAPDPDTYLEHIYYYCVFGGNGLCRKDKCATSLIALRKQESSDKGCLCSFEVKRLYLHPHVAKITYESISHVDANGFLCHDKLNPNNINKALIQTVHISPALQEWIISGLEHTYTPQQILNEHRELVQNRVKQGGAIVEHTNGEYLSGIDISSIAETFVKGRVVLQNLDETAVLLWRKRHERKVFFYEQQSTANTKIEAGTTSFVIGIQTSWQKGKMLAAGQEPLVICETTYGPTKLQYRMFTILSVDQYYNGIPVAWIITPNINQHDAQPWMEALRQSMLEASVDWKPRSFVVDNLPSSTKEIWSVWGGKVQIYLSQRRVKSAWRKKLTSLVKGWSIRTMLFERLGSIMDKTYPSYVSLRQRLQRITELVEELFAECLYACKSFHEYFQREWMTPRKICSWAKCLMDLPTASMKISAATESYLANLKRRNLCCKNRLAGRRISWLLDSLVCDVEAQYIRQEQLYDGRISRTSHQEKLFSGAYHRARSIPDDHVELPTYRQEPAKVRSMSKPYVEYLVYNGHHEWACCTCSWSRMGDLCKHVVKVAEMYRARNAQNSGRPLTPGNIRKLPTLSMSMTKVQAAREEGLNTSDCCQQASDEENSETLTPHDAANLEYPASMIVISASRADLRDPSLDEGTSVIEMTKEIKYQEAEFHNFMADNPELMHKYLISYQELKNRFFEEHQSPIRVEASDDPVGDFFVKPEIFEIH